MMLVGVMGCSADKPAGQRANNTAAGTDSATLGSAEADVGKMPDLFSGMWLSFSSFVEDDATLNVPYTAKAQKYVDAYRQRRDIPYAEEGCKSPGLPIAMRMGQVKFAYAPGLISVYMQSAGDTRFIRMNRKQGKTSPKYYGNSVGHWEGDTLVVETVDFANEISFQYGVGKPLPPAETVGTASLGPPPAALLASLSAAIWGPHGEGMRMVERMRLLDADTLEAKLTIYDDSVWTKPYVMSTRNYKRMINAEPEEWVCSVSITSFDPDTNNYVDKDPEEMVKYLDKLGR
jgi:hypothetical protein